MLGGTSSMNAMMWVRGFAADYDEWDELAGEQWNFANVEPYFCGIENGPLVMSAQRSPRSSTGAWLRAARQAGYQLDQPNHPELDGFCQTRVNQRRGAQGLVVYYGGAVRCSVPR
jgi:choline dehydrogenase